MTKERFGKQQNKGVHVPSDSISTSLSNSKNAKDEDRSLTQMKNDVKAVIELMGPNTPHFEQTASVSDEESVFPNTTTASQKEFKIEDDPISQTENDFSTLPPDVTIHDTDLSLMVDNPTTQTNQQCICPPPTYPARYVYNSECMCPQVANYFQNKYQEAHTRPKSEKTKFFRSVCNIFKDKKNTWPRKGDYYTVNIKQSTKNFGLPRRLVFDLVEDISKETGENPCEIGICEECCLNKIGFHPIHPKKSKSLKPEVMSSKNTKFEENLFPVENDYKALCKNQKTSYIDSNGATRVDVYYFDHGCSNYFRTTDRTPVLATEALAERTEAYTTKFWAEVFGTFNIGFSFLTSFILQFLRFILYTIVRPLTVGVFQLISDYLFKPLLCAIFNALVQPILIFLYNIASSVRDFCDPVAEAVGYFIRELSAPIRAFRVVEVRKEIHENSTSKQGTKRIFRKNNRLV